MKYHIFNPKNDHALALASLHGVVDWAERTGIARVDASSAALRNSRLPDTYVDVEFANGWHACFFVDGPALPDPLARLAQGKCYVDRVLKC